MTERSWVSGEQHTITALLDRRLADDPDSQYLDVCGTTFTAAEVNTTASRLANALRELGVRPGDRVANLIENSPEALLVVVGRDPRRRRSRCRSTPRTRASTSAISSATPARGS